MSGNLSEEWIASLLYIPSHCKFSLLVYIRNEREITKLMFSHFLLFEPIPNAKLPIFKHNKKQILPYSFCQFCENQVRQFTTQFSQIHLVRNLGFSMWICERCVKYTGCTPQSTRGGGGHWVVCLFETYFCYINIVYLRTRGLT